MADITKCANKNCKIKEICYRYTAVDGYWQSYADFNNSKVIKDKKECENFLLDRRKNMTLEEEKQKKKEYNHKYYIEHKERYKEYHKKYYNKRKNENPNYFKEYYEKNKEKIYEYNSKWRKNNSKQFAQLVHNARKRRVERLREQGCTNAWMVVTRGDKPKFKRGDSDEL